VYRGRGRGRRGETVGVGKRWPGGDRRAIQRRGFPMWEHDWRRSGRRTAGS
jgi:hypothetical protein